MERTAYTVKEKGILATLIREKGSVIECKKTDSVNLAKKNEMWEEICTYYNAQPEVNCKRTAKQLKKCWANLKQTKRKLTTEKKYEMLKTGGGSTTSQEENPLMDLIDEAAPHLDVQLDCPFDSSARFEKQLNTSDAEIMVQVNNEPPKKKSCPPEQEQEKALRIQKLKKAIEQQRERHELRLQAARAELQAVIENNAELHQIKLLTAKAELEAAKKALDN